MLDRAPPQSNQLPWWYHQVEQQQRNHAVAVTVTTPPPRLCNGGVAPDHHHHLGREIDAYYPPVDSPIVEAVTPSSHQLQPFIKPAVSVQQRPVHLVAYKSVHVVEKSLSPVVEMVNHTHNAIAAPDLSMMDEIWNGEFAKVFQPYLPNIWYLTATEICPSPRWRRFKDSAKVRFCCQTCGHGWTSMKGRVVFWYFLHIPYCEGFVQFKLYGQQCQRCDNGMFESAMWYPEEVNKVLCNLYNRIGQTYYGFVKPPIRYDRRAGKPRTQHNATLCQACRDGECDSRPRTGTPTTTTTTPTATVTSHCAQQTAAHAVVPAMAANKLQVVTSRRS